MAMRRKQSIRARLERLETAMATKTSQPYREAFIELGSCEAGERHLVMVSSPDQAANRPWRLAPTLEITNDEYGSNHLAKGKSGHTALSR